MRPASGDYLPGCVRDDDLVHDELAIALDVAIDDNRSRRKPLPDSDRCEQFPFLARVQIAEDVGQVPFERAIHGVIKDQGRSDWVAEWRPIAIPRIVVASDGDIPRNKPRPD